MVASPAAPPPPPVPPDSTAKLYERMLSLATEVLRRRAYGNLPESDRADLAHQSAGTAVKRWHTFDPAVGAERQWVSGIVRREVWAYRRASGRLGLAEPLDAERALPSDAATLEETVERDDLLEHLLRRIPAHLARVVRLTELYDLSEKAAGKVEGVSESTACRRRKDGMEALAAAAEKWRAEQKALGVVPLPFTLASLFAANRRLGHAPPELGLDDGPGNEPPESGKRRRAPEARDTLPPGSPARVERLLRKLGVLGVLPVMTFLMDAPSRFDHDHEHGIAAVAHAEADTVSVANATMEGQAAPVTPAAPPATSAVKVRGQAAYLDREDPEGALLQQAAQALARHRLTTVFDALAQHAARFPSGETATREYLWGNACAEARQRAGYSEGSPLATHCAGRP